MNGKELEPWEKILKGRMLPGDNFDEFKSRFTNLDPNLREIRDALRLIRIEDQVSADVGHLRLRNVVVRLLGRVYPEEDFVSYNHALYYLFDVYDRFRGDKEVKELVKRYKDELDWIQG